MDLSLSKKEEMKKAVTRSYSCPIHADIIAKKPGKCPKCGADLLKSKKVQMKEEVVNNYNCPMHPDVTSDKTGKCTKCGMDLISKKPETKEHQH
jgi:hypothetical protein